MPCRLCGALYFTVMIERILAQLKIDEGIRLTPYYCTSGYLTIGIGRNLEVNGISKNELTYLINNNEERKKRYPTDWEIIPYDIMLVAMIRDFKRYGISNEEAEVLCINDIHNCIGQCEYYIKWFPDAPQEVKEVLVNMCFNLGIRSLLQFKNTLFYMSIGEYKKAAEGMMKSKWYRQVKNRALRLIERIKNMEK